MPLPEGKNRKSGPLTSRRGSLPTNKDRARAGSPVSTQGRAVDSLMVFVGKLDDLFQNSNLTGTAGLVILRKALRPAL